MKWSLFSCPTTHGFVCLHNFIHVYQESNYVSETKLHHNHYENYILHGVQLYTACILDLCIIMLENGELIAIESVDFSPMIMDDSTILLGP